ncbi:hypothetical protein HPB48_012636 [Haemaphysalis longicornis]|uniref:Membrane glycoprotein lig-1 n=1 Tax=Haemaphysalis longicornis TaxID=44386 RepID=A0A9J6FZ29_HAELO|nr:hypothetical protein HPB48_012636 [Haemaphysalis longicornis]
MARTLQLPPLLLLLLTSAWSEPTSESPKYHCLVPGCDCTMFDEAGDIFLRCANHSLRQFPELIHGVVGVDASHNFINALPTFPKRPLQVLDLHFNRISELSPGVFAGLNVLEVLDLSHNNIAEVHPECFEGLGNLLVLNLTENFLEVLKPGIFGAMPRLKKLMLARNSLKAIDPSWLLSLHALEHLDLRMLGLRSLPKATFRAVPTLKLLELSDNDFEHVPTEAIGSATSLEVLHLEHNPIKTLDSKSFSQITSIQELHLSAMPLLESVEDGTFVGLNSLKVLDLANNPLLSFIGAGAFGTQPGKGTLEELYLAYDNLTMLPFGGFEWCGVHILDPARQPVAFCNSPDELSGVPVTELITNDLHCEQHSAAVSGSEQAEEVHHHGHMTLRLLVVTAGLVTLLMAVAVVLVAFRRDDIRYWYQNRKRVGAVYYVKANSPNSSNRVSQV